MEGGGCSVQGGGVQGAGCMVQGAGVGWKSVDIRFGCGKRCEKVCKVGHAAFCGNHKAWEVAQILI